MGLHGVVARLSRGISMGSLPILVAKLLIQVMPQPGLQTGFEARCRRVRFPLGALSFKGQ